MRRVVIDTRVYEVSGPSEAEAIARVADEPDRAPVYHSTTAEPLPVAPARAPVLRVLPGGTESMPGRSGSATGER